MTEPPVLLPEANADVADAYHWYESQSIGLGIEFLRCIEAAILSIQRTPQIHAVMHETFRRALVRRFPFAVFFEFDRDHNRCLVYAVFHCSQNPHKWKERMPKA